MKQPAINEQLVRRYLLGDLPRRERERLEASLLTDDRYYESLTALEDEVEDELIEEYLDQELTRTEQENFERAFLNSPERLHKLKVLKDLKEHALTATHDAPHPKTTKGDPGYRKWIPAIAVFQNPLFGLSSATAFTLALLCCAWLWIRSSNLEAQLQQAKVQQPADSSVKQQVEQLTRRNEELTAKLKLSEEERARAEQEMASLKSRETQQVSPPNQASTPPRSTFASVMLSPGIRSSDSQATLTLGAGQAEGRLILNVHGINPKDYKRVRAIVKKQAGAEVWRSENVKLQSIGNNARAVLSVPAEKLTEGQYEAELEDVERPNLPIGLYVFRVVHK